MASHDYFKKIEENRRRNREMLKQQVTEFYEEFPEIKEEIELQKNNPKTEPEIRKVGSRRRTMDPTFIPTGAKRKRRQTDMTPTRRSARLSNTNFNNENTSNDDEDNYSSESDSDSNYGRRLKKKRRTISERRRISEPLMELKTFRRSTPGARATQVPEIPVEKVDDRLISKISRHSGRKVYDSVNGTTCHQCRQKTRDTKSVCRSGSCVGVRGMFCGPCLQNRYGEDVAEVLKDPNWSCPPCRGDCNCSICRTRLGKIPTGIMVPFIREKGYAHLREYLNKNPEDDE